MNPIGAVIIIFLTTLVLAGSRRTATLAMMAGVLFVSQNQQISMGGLNMFSVRFLEIAGFIRVMSRREFSFAGLSALDKAVIWLYAYNAIVYVLRSAEGQAYVIGMTVDAFLCYFTFRGLIETSENFEAFLDSFVYLLLPFALLVVVESVTRHNPYAFEGGGMYSWIRHGRLRCVATFRNPDLLGTVGAVFLPLYIARAFKEQARKLSIVAMVCCAITVWGCNSGGPVSATGAGLIGWGLWRLRGRMHIFRRGLSGAILLAALLMKAPVYYLIARASQITGGEGWHRSYLIDVWIQHFNLWWLAGMPMAETMTWFPYALESGADITNTFVGFGLSAGVGAIVLLILLLVRAYKALSSALAAVRTGSEETIPAEYLLWGMGAMLGAHIINWFGITYFDQSYVIWFMQLAAISSVTASCLKDGIHEIPRRDSTEDEPMEPVVVLET